MTPSARLAVILAVLPLPLWAQGAPDCGATTQAEMNECAAADHAAADEALNDLYAAALDAARSLDEAVGGDLNEASLRDAQRAWLPFRDAACTAESTPYDGGSMRPMVESSCLARLTRQRAEDLAAYAQDTAG